MRLGAEASAEISLWSWKLQVDGAEVVSGLSVLQIHHFQGCWGCPVGLGLLWDLLGTQWLEGLQWGSGSTRVLLLGLEIGKSQQVFCTRVAGQGDKWGIPRWARVPVQAGPALPGSVTLRVKITRVSPVLHPQQWMNRSHG